MSQIRGMRVRLVTADEKDAQTDDHIYVGVVGTGGGREFPLAAPHFDDFERGTNVVYRLGTIFESGPAGAKQPAKSQPGEVNDPAQYQIELTDVNHVYVRKQGERSHGGDNAYKMDAAIVELFARESDTVGKRVFSGGNVWLGNEFGNQVWLPEH